LSQKNDPQVSIFTPDRVPGITVQLPVYNEPGVIERLIDSVCQLDWPGDRIEIQILDDSDDRITTERAHHQAAMWRQRGVQIQVIQRDDRTGYKAGALAHGMTTARGDYIAIFDADFTPDPDFLKQVMPSFFQVDQARIGMVQARWGHLNRDQGLLTQLEALLLDGHFLLEHTARYRNQRFFN
ncbi:MAG: glycosyltransferase, partial [Planctomycetaceae bacterium]|nr:glycosyltransferase [Planctomycetaceae bacterium]